MQTGAVEGCRRMLKGSVAKRISRFETRRGFQRLHAVSS